MTAAWALFAHCVALTVNAVRLPMERRPRAVATADRLAEAVSLDMTAQWAPTVRTYFGRVTKTRILDAVREAVSIEAAERMADMKKPDMAEAAEQLLAANGLVARFAADIANHATGEGRPQAQGVAEANHAEAYSDAAE